ncbi:MAG: sigma-54-dependent Fis family transcriptional regulator [Deltaproteobacteria bacterium]|nr:sigma-54-dependent Fis family transcriptional regulator [Deltaproteobacteria bacterium]
MPKASLPAPQRRFLELVAEAVYLNPFGAERRELDLRLAECSEDTPPGEVLDRVVGRVSAAVGDLEAAGLADVRRFEGRVQQTVQAALLFEAFHRFIDPMDAHLLEQLDAGDTPRPVPFAREALGYLTRRGFSPAEASRFFAIFFQLRRAFYFIDRALVGRGSSMEELRRRLWNNIFGWNVGWYERHLWNRLEDFSTLLLGETGTGKGTAAAAIGRSGFIPFDEKKGAFSESFTRSFITLNLSEHPETLLESELFGHRKGAFTGAVENHPGIFARCSPHGAIFLDEIGDVSIPVQVKLLQVLQERTFSPVGAHERLRFQGRVIAATNRPLDELRAREQFRDDFYYRLCSDTITVPPLRRRLQEDPRELEELVGHVVRRLAGEAVPELVGFVLTVLSKELPADYAWPGNVRELEQAVRRILLTGHYAGETRARNPSRSRGAAFEAGAWDAAELLAEYCAQLYERLGSYEEVARRTKLDRRTVRKHVQRARGDA